MSFFLASFIAVFIFFLSAINSSNKFADADPVRIITSSDSDVEGRLENVESEIKNLRTRAQPVSEETNIIPSPAIKQLNEQNRQQALEDNEERIKDAREEAEKEGEVKELDTLATKERVKAADEIIASSEAVETQLKEEEAQEIAKINSDSEKMINLQANDEEAEESLEKEALKEETEEDEKKADKEDRRAVDAAMEAETEIQNANDLNKIEEAKEEAAKKPAEELAKGNIGTAEAYAASAPYPCIQAEKDLQKGCNKEEKKSHCKAAAKEIETVEKEASEAQEELEAEESNKESSEETVFMQKMQKAIQGKKTMPKPQKAAQKRRSHSIGFL